MKTTKTTNDILHTSPHPCAHAISQKENANKLGLSFKHVLSSCGYLLLSFQYQRVWFILYREVHLLRKENIVNCFSTNYHTPIIFKLFNK